jgi:hypothetical protein
VLLAVTGVEIVDAPVGFDAPLPQPARTVNAATDQQKANARCDTS